MCLLHKESPIEVPFRLLTVLLPLFPAILFVWNILRQRMLPIVVERTFIYGGVLAIVVCFIDYSSLRWPQLPANE